MARGGLVLVAAIAATAAAARPKVYNTSSRRVEGMLNLHLVPHTHDDVGWLKTVDEYYYGSRNDLQRAVVQIILTATVQQLAANPSRKFTYVEQAFFQRWWAEQDGPTQALVQQLVANGQLEFINGGWCMHDEASPGFADMIDQTTLGHRLLKQQFGVMPKTTWQIDPFGHSGFQASMMSAPGAGFDAVFFARADYQDVGLRMKNKSMEMIWAPSASQGKAAATFAGILFNGYGPPGFVDMDIYSNSDPIMDDETLEDYNVGAYVDQVVGAAQGQQAHYRGGDVMWTMGSDFNYENAATWFKNMDKMIHYVNADGRINVLYSTPSEYARAKIASSSYPLKTDDFFPYADGPHAYWTGYFVSRAALKGYVRDSSSLFQAAKQLQTGSGGAADLGPDNPLYAFERALGVAQHHDGVSGTSKQHVAYDYARRLSTGRAGAWTLIGDAFAALTGWSPATPFAACELANATICPALESGQATVITVYNSQPQSRAAASGGTPLRIPVGLPAGVGSWRVLDAGANAVVAQLIPLSPRDAQLRGEYYGYNSPTPVQNLAFVVSALPGAGWSTYFLLPVPSVDDAPLTHVSTPRAVATGTGAGDSTLASNVLSLTFAGASGELASYTDLTTGATTPLSQAWAYYRSSVGNDTDGQHSGAYIFRPNVSTAFPVGGGGAVGLQLVTGPVVNEAWQTWTPWLTQVVRLWPNRASAEIEYTVGPIDWSDGWGKEVITQYTTPLATNGSWVTDSNGRDSMARGRNYRATWPLQVEEPVSGNYAPVNAFIAASDVATGATLSVVTDRTQGGASLVDGQLEVMVHRRTLQDDGRGVGEPLNETGIDGRGLIIRGVHRLSIDASRAAAGTKRRANVADLMFSPRTWMVAPLDAGVTPAAWVAAHTATGSLLRADLPPQLHLLTAHSYGPTSLLLRLSHSFEAGDALGAPASAGLASLFAAFNITAATEMTLTGNQPLAAATPVTYNIDDGSSVTLPVVPPPPAGAALTVTLAPMQIRTFMCTTTPQDGYFGAPAGGARVAA